MRNVFRCIILVIIALINAGWTSPLPVETVLHSFEGSADGGIPYAGLLADKEGALYGATDIGGYSTGCDGYGCGTVFRADAAR